MKPTNQKKSFHSESVRRARLLVEKNFFWLKGFPYSASATEITYCTMESNPYFPGGIGVLNSKSLSNLHFVYKKLKNEYAGVASQVTKDFSGWEEGVPIHIVELKKYFHNPSSFNLYQYSKKFSLTPSFVELRDKVILKYSESEKLIGAVVCCFYKRKAILRSILEMVFEKGDILFFWLSLSNEASDYIWILRTLELLSINKNLDSDYIWRTFFTSSAKNYPKELPRDLFFKLDQHLSIIKKSNCLSEVKKFEWPTFSSYSFQRIWRDIYECIRPLKNKKKEEFLRLISLYFDDKFIIQSKQEFDDLVKLKKQIEICEKTNPGKPLKVILKDVRLKLSDLKKKATFFSVPDFYEQLHLLISGIEFKFFIVLRKFIQSSPLGVYRTIDFLYLFKKRMPSEFNDFFKHSFTRKEYILCTVEHLTLIPDFKPSDNLLPLLLDLIVRKSEEYWLENINDFFKLLKVVLENPKTFNQITNCYNLDILHDLFDKFEDEKVAFRYFAELIKSGLYDEYIDSEVFEISLMISDSPKAWTKIVSKLLKVSDEKEEILRLINNVLVVMKETALWPLVLSAFKGIDNRIVYKTVLYFESAQKLDSKFKINFSNIKQTNKSWFSIYPRELWNSLSLLDQFESNAGESAKEILKKDFIHKRDLEEQLNFIQKQLKVSPIGKRNKLENRLSKIEKLLREKPVKISERRLNNLKLKLEKRTLDAVFENIRIRSQEVIRNKLLERMKGAKEIELLFEENNLKLVGHIVGLGKRDQQLAFEILRTRFSHPYWDLRDHPKNMKFIQVMEDKGLNLDFWLDKNRQQVNSSKGRLDLYLEKDPLEIFRMGGYFKTCLSPGDFNFFSVLANAADINKQVLFCRNEEGKVEGRALLGLTYSGELLSFNPYSHDRQIKFDQIVADFVFDLAQKMGATVSSLGKVPVIVANHWYDDGPYNYSSLAISNSHNRSTWVNFLKEVRPIRFLQQLKSKFQISTLDARVLSFLFSFSEFISQPQLIKPLLKSISGCVSLAMHEKSKAVSMAYQINEFSFCKKVLFRDGGRELKAYLCHEGFFRDLPLLKVLAHLFPSYTLRLIHRTRPVYVHSDEEEIGYRLEALRVAYNYLGRQKKVKALPKRI